MVEYDIGLREAGLKDPGKEKDMATLNRNYGLYSVSCESLLEKHNEWGYDFVRSYKAKPMRDNVDLAKIQKG